MRLQKNEKIKRQSKANTAGKKAGLEAPQTPTNCSQQEAPRDESQVAGTPQKASPEADNGSGEKNTMGTVESVVDRFLSKKETRAAEYRELIEEMMGDYSRYGWAESTLLGIYDFINETGCITEKQIEAIENIRRSRL